MAHLFLPLLVVLMGVHCSLQQTTSNSPATITKYEINFNSLDPSISPTVGTATISFTTTTGATNVDVTVYWGTSLLSSAGNVDPVATDFTSAGATPTLSPLGSDRKLTITLAYTAPTTSSTTYTLVANFKTILRTDMKGLFLGKFTNPSDKSISYLIATDLRPQYGRELFPCNDTITTAQVPIELSLNQPSGYSFSTASLDTPNKGTTTTPDTYKDTSASINLNFFGFAVGINMPTMAPTSSLKPADSTTTLSFAGTKDTIAATTFQSNIDFLATYYYQAEKIVGVNHPLQKLTIVLVPNLPMPFATFGIIYIRDDTYNGDYTTPQSASRFKSLVVPVIHEYFRQFTEFSTRPSTWGDAWLSQAMATFLKYTLLNSLNTGFEFRSDIPVVTRQTALAMDSAASNPLQSTDPAPYARSKIQSLLTNPLKALKGAFLLAMADQSISAGVVYQTIKTFLTNQRVQKKSSDFFSADSNLNQFSAWTTGSIGYPTLTLSAPTATSVDITLAYPTTTTYNVPVTVDSKTSPATSISRQNIKMDNTATKQTITININVTNDWVIANQQSIGYYRATYTDDDWMNIIRALASDDKDLKGYTHIVDDAFALAFAPQSTLNLAIPLNLSVSLLMKKEGSFANWFPVYNGLSMISDKIWEQSVGTDFQSFMTSFLGELNNLMERGSLDSYEKAQVSSLFYNHFCTFNVGNYRATSTASLADILNGKEPSSVPTSSYDSLACCGAQNSQLKAQDLWTTISDPGSTHYTRHYNAIALGCLSNFADVSSQLNTILKSTDDNVLPYIMTAMWNLAGKRPADLLSYLATDTTGPAAKLLQDKLGDQPTSALLAMMAAKLSNDTDSTNFNTLSANPNLNDDVKTAASNGAITVTSSKTWLGTNKDKLLGSLASAEAQVTPSNNNNTNTTPAPKSGATTSTLSVFLVIPLFALKFSTMS